ncbi:mediator of RNA polymerase II transcription subunit 1 [Notolabrus celidotus]|uniref:mediator of RNA polymerase II transcription subunit 1 n=1 Tax=Notolabrus celidotus TaxID=1203425 RepID=UPI00148FB8C9|nr:mediator of RNA polymerase II transcription subunit 1 [Notolabrus celidotus]XP_034562516.1 mediator of RNA polymerase II transcription subunit 1 [Notolabrus celidotus]
MKTKSIISDLHLKFAEKPWNETFQLVRRCMDRSRDESKPCELLVRSLERLQEVCTVSSMNAAKSRLEMIAKQQRMGFHITEATCYLTADLFYLEVVLLPSGGVMEVKVAPHGGSPVPSESFLQLLRSHNFAEFSVKLEGLYNQYNIPGDNEVKLKLFASLQCLGEDLQQMSALQRAQKDFNTEVEMINNGSTGSLTAGKEDCPMMIQFYINPKDGANISDLHVTNTERVIHAAQVTVGDSDVTHMLQTASVIAQPAQLDSQGVPVFLPLSKVLCETLPAVFLLKLQPAIPILASLVNRISHITDVPIPDVGLQWAPLPKLLMRRSSANSQLSDEQDAIFKMSLPCGVTHSYALPGSAWKEPPHRAAVVDSIPFTHPSHIPTLLELLRHQCLINTLLWSCFTSQCEGAGLVCDLHFEVLPESESSFSVTFQQPKRDSLAVLLVNVTDAHHITCTLYGAEMWDPSMNEDLSNVLMGCLSIPITLSTLHSKLYELTTTPLSPGCPATTEAENDHSAPSNAAMTDISGASTTFSQSLSVPEDSFSVSGSACYAVSVAKSEPCPEINTSPAVEPYSCTAPVGAFPHWVTSNGQLSDPI